MQTLINDLLSFSRVSTRGQPFGVVDCHIVLRQALLANLKVAITETHAVITHDEPLPQLIADSTQMVQVFQNLISNAIKFRSEQPPQIHIGVARTDGEVGRTGGGENIELGSPHQQMNGSSGCAIMELVSKISIAIAFLSSFNVCTPVASILVLVLAWQFVKKLWNATVDVSGLNHS